MQKKLDKTLALIGAFLVDKKYMLPCLVLAICEWRLFMPHLPVNDGTGWDGAIYYQLAVDGADSTLFNSYFFFRVFPAFFVRSIFGLFHIAFTPQNVVLAFKAINTVLLFLAALMTKQIFGYYRLRHITQIIGFVIIFMCYGVLNFTYYYPVMTDTPAFFLSIALFYFFVRGEQLNVMLVGLIGMFTLPVLAAMAIALLLFPKTENDNIPLGKGVLWTICLLSALYAIFVAYYTYFVVNDRITLRNVFPVSEQLLPISIVCVGVAYFFFPFVIRDARFFSWRYYFAQIKLKQLFAVIALVLVVVAIRLLAPVKSAEAMGNAYSLSIYQQVRGNFLYGLMRPAIFCVNHFNFFGVVIVLAIIFWKSLSSFITRFGLGVSVAFFLCVFFFFVNPESRKLSFFMPWLMLLTILFLEQFSFSRFFYISVVVLNVLFAKLWLFFDFVPSPLLSDGTIDFPQQWFFMHLGVWIAEKVWFALLILFFVALLLIVLSLFKLKGTRLQKSFVVQRVLDVSNRNPSYRITYTTIALLLVVIMFVAAFF